MASGNFYPAGNRTAVRRRLMGHAVLSLPRGDLRAPRRRAARDARPASWTSTSAAAPPAPAGPAGGRRSPAGPGWPPRRGARPHRGGPGRAAPGAARGGRGGPRAAGRPALRLALLAVGVAQAGFAWPVLVSGAGAMSAPVHMAHETGAWNLAVAAAFLAVAAAPRLAAGALPFLGSFAALLVPVTLADLGAGHVHADRAVAHLLLLAGVVARGRRWPGAAAAGRGAPRSRRPAGARVRRSGAAVRRRAAARRLAAGRRRRRRRRPPRTPTLVSTEPGEGARLERRPAR